MDVFATYQTNETLENEGVWKNLTKTARVKVARSGNPNYNAELRTQLQAHQLELEAGGVDADKVAEKIFIDVESRTILLDWEGLEYRGKPVVHTPAMAATLLRVKDFRRRVKAIADDFETYRLKEEEAQGNESANSQDGA